MPATGILSSDNGRGEEALNNREESRGGGYKDRMMGMTCGMCVIPILTFGISFSIL